MIDEVDGDISLELYIASNSNDCEIIKEKESEIALKVKEKEKMEKQLREKLSKIEYDEEINEIQDSFDEYVDKDYLEQIDEFKDYMEEISFFY